MRSLDTLRRLARQAVDRERQALMAIGGEITAIEEQIEAHRSATERERSADNDFMTSAATLAAFIQTTNAKIDELECRRHRLQEAYDAQVERVREERVGEKRYERMAERRSKQAEREAAVQEQKTIDELVTMSRGRK